MDNVRQMFSTLGDWVLGQVATPPANTPGGTAARRQAPSSEPAMLAVRAEPFSMDQVERFFTAPGFVPGNAFASEVFDENGPLPGRDSSRFKRNPGSLAAQFDDETSSTRALLFAPNDAPDELPKDPVELQSTLRQPDTLLRHRYMV